MNTWLEPGYRRLLLFAGLGAMAGLGQEPFGLWFLTLASLGVAFHLGFATPFRFGFGTGWALGLGYFTLTLFWIMEPFQVDAARHGWMAPFALVFMAAGLALFWGAAFAVAARAKRYRGLAVALGLTLAEYLRATVFTGFPWAMPAYIWSGLPPAQFAAWIGPFGLTFVTLFSVALPLLLPRGKAFVAAIVVIVVLFGGGYLRLVTTSPEFTGAQIRIVQPNIAQTVKWDPARGEEFFQKHLRLSRGAPTDLVIWPESAVQWWLGDDPAREAAITRAANAPVILGTRRREGRRIFNTAAVIKDGEIDQIYDKRHLVPFGEYIPFGGMLERFGFYGLAAENGSGFSAGTSEEMIDVSGVGKALPLICYEAIFPWLANAAVRPDYLLQVTNDGWFGSFSGPPQHFAQARFRAIEQGLPLVRSANTGISALVDARGQILASLPIDREGVLDVDLPKALSPTMYSRTGDVPGMVLLLVGLFLLMLRSRKH